MQARTAQKRSATSAGSSAPHPPNPKKLRFVDPGDDPVNFAEEVDNALENPSAKRKGRVRNEGYESDSSDDGEGVVLSRRKDESGDGAADEDDMFTIGDKKANQNDVPSGKKKESYLRLGDIEGQEFNEDGSDADADSDLSDEPEDEDDARRRTQVGMGFEMSSFNMREEMEEGKFAADGTYVRTFDPHVVHDRWMDGVDEKEIKIARHRKRQQDRIQKEKIKAEERELEQSGGMSALEIQLVGMLKRGETVLEALQRLGTRSKKQSGKHTNGKPKDDSSMAVDKQPAKGMSDIDMITHLASNIMSLGDIDIYSKTYEQLVRNVRSSGQVNDDWLPPSADVKYEYRWKVLGQQRPGESYGPFGEEELKTWFKAAYFGVYGEKVDVRMVGGEWGEWDDVVT
ncbi:hypothetical protein JVU11DRAFT_756 [Chiua virens]|nr:hypothetical protein JVU11DRAFT_756 [Chiua virens]